MARNQSDPILNAAHIVSKNMGNTALTYRNKAHNDKTYMVTILGVNQDFTDDVLEDDKKTITNKYNIPNTVYDDNGNYYTIKIDGIYYCRKQNGNFKLYERCLLRVPNNNWDNMFLERPYTETENTVTASGESTAECSVFTDVDAPPSASDCKFWMVADGGVNTTTYNPFPATHGMKQINVQQLYISNTTESDTTYSWELADIIVSEDAPPIDTSAFSKSTNPSLPFWVKVSAGSTAVQISINKVKKVITIIGDTTKVTYVWDPIATFDSSNVESDNVGFNALPLRYYDKKYGRLYVCNFPPAKSGDIWYKIGSWERKEFEGTYRCYTENNSQKGLVWVPDHFVEKHAIITSAQEPKDIKDPQQTFTDKGSGYYVCCDKVDDKIYINSLFRLYNSEPRIYETITDFRIVDKYPVIGDTDSYYRYSGNYIYVYVIDPSIQSPKVFIAKVVLKNGKIIDIEKIDDKNEAVVLDCPYLDLRSGDYWAEIYSPANRRLKAMHIYRDNKWQLLYRGAPKLYPDTLDPATRPAYYINGVKYVNDVHVGDYWVKVDTSNERKMIAFYERVVSFNNNKTIEAWELLYSAGEGGGGGGSGQGDLYLTIENAIIVDKNGVIYPEDDI